MAQLPWNITLIIWWQNLSADKCIAAAADAADAGAALLVHAD